MKIFILNCGSSSVKCCLYDLKTAPLEPVDPVWTAQLQWKNIFDEPTLAIKNGKGAKFLEKVKEPTMAGAVGHLVEFLFHGETAVLKNLQEINVIGHRIVHGGKYFKESIILNAEAKEKIRKLAELAPLHNQPALNGIEVLESKFQNIPHVAIFDTAFHHTLPLSARIYPGPYKWYEEGIQRYGFHGISFQYCSKQAAHILKRSQKGLRMVICHLGSGASLCAVQDGKSIDTTMGFTPLEGLMMDTRCGSVDPGIILYLLEEKKKTPLQMSHELYKESGMLGLSGISSDMRDVMEQRKQGSERAAIALDVYLHRLNALIGAMIASLQGIDALVFTAGIGENSVFVRENVCKQFAFLGVQLDKEKNAKPSREDLILSTKESKVNVLLVHTQEALEMASECWEKISR